MVLKWLRMRNQKTARFLGRKYPKVAIGSKRSIGEYSSVTNEIRLGKWKDMKWYRVGRNNNIEKTIAVINHETVHWLIWQLEDWATCVMWDYAQGIPGVWDALYRNRHFKVG